MDRTCSYDSKERSISRPLRDWQCSVKSRSKVLECSSNPAKCPLWKMLLARKKGSVSVNPCRRKRPWCCKAWTKNPTFRFSLLTVHLKLLCACLKICRQRLSLSGPIPKSLLSHPSTCPNWQSRAAYELVAARLSALSCRSQRRKYLAALATISASRRALTHCSFALSKRRPKQRIFSPESCSKADSSQELERGRSRLQIQRTRVEIRSGMDLAMSVRRLMASRVSVGTFTLLRTALRSPPFSKMSSYSSSCSISGRSRFLLVLALVNPQKSWGRKWLILVRKQTSYFLYLFSDLLSFSQNFWSAANTFRFSSSSKRLREILVSRSSWAISCCRAAERAVQSLEEWTVAWASTVNPLYSTSIMSGTLNRPRLRVICRMQLPFLNCCRSCFTRSLPTIVLRSWKVDTSLSYSNPTSSDTPATSYFSCPNPSTVGLQCLRRSSRASQSITTRTTSSTQVLNRSTITYQLSPFRNQQSQLQSKIFLLSLRGFPSTPFSPSGTTSPTIESFILSSSFFFRRYSSRRSAGGPCPLLLLLQMGLLFLLGLLLLLLLLQLLLGLLLLFLMARLRMSGCRWGSSRPSGMPEWRLLPCSVSLS